MTLDAAWVLLGVVAAQRLSELVLDRRNTRRLLAVGAQETGAGHYPVIVAIHAGWLAALVLWQVQHHAPLQPVWTALYVLLQPLRVWIIASLGHYWTTRVISLPTAPLVRRGPYRFVRHPNYLLVAAEIAILPLCLGAWPIAVIFSVLNTAVLTVRLRVENRALAARRA